MRSGKFKITEFIKILESKKDGTYKDKSKITIKNDDTIEL